MPGSGLKLRPSTPEGPFLVVGLARSGAAVARLLTERGESVVGVDSARPDEAERLASTGVEVHLNESGIELLDAVSTVVKSPGVPQEAPVITAARTRELPVLGELEVAWRSLSNRFIAVTGTNGKTTVTELLGHIYRAAGEPVAVAGNIGSPVSDLVGQVDPEATVVCECSSFQLEDTEAFAPECGVFLNIAEDHLDRHATMESYLAAKLRMFENQTAGDIAVLCDGDAYAAAHWHHEDGAEFHEVGWEPEDGADAVAAADQAAWGRGSTLVTYCSAGGADACDMTYRDGGLSWRGEPLLDAAELSIVGRHNVDNAMAAAAAALAMGVDIEGVREGLKSFPGVPHRLERVDDVNGVLYVNDSKATNPAAAAAAIRSFDPPIRVILGGSSKGGSFAELVDAVGERGASCYLIGDAADQIEKELRAGVGESGSRRSRDADLEIPQVEITREPDLDHAVRAAAADASSGEVVLLSPACASFDAYRDFEQRGEHFRSLVGAHANPGQAR